MPHNTAYLLPYLTGLFNANLAVIKMPWETLVPASVWYKFTYHHTQSLQKTKHSILHFQYDISQKKSARIKVRCGRVIGNLSYPQICLQCRGGGVLCAIRRPKNLSDRKVEPSGSSRIY